MKIPVTFLVNTARYALLQSQRIKGIFSKWAYLKRTRSSTSCKLRDEYRTRMSQKYLRQIHVRTSYRCGSVKFLKTKKIHKEKIHDWCVTEISGINGSFKQVKKSKREKNFLIFWRSISRETVSFTHWYISYWHIAV